LKKDDQGVVTWNKSPTKPKRKRKVSGSQQGETGKRKKKKSHKGAISPRNGRKKRVINIQEDQPVVNRKTKVRATKNIEWGKKDHDRR